MSRELDAAVAVKLFGWKWFPMSSKYEWIAREPEYVDGRNDTRDEPPDDARLHFACNLPEYTTDPAADYLVLCHVREKWESSPRQSFTFQLNSDWAMRAHKADREVDRLIMYEPGDYSRAALAVLKEATPCAE